MSTSRPPRFLVSCRTLGVVLRREQDGEEACWFRWASLLNCRKGKADRAFSRIVFVLTSESTPYVLAS